MVTHKVQIFFWQESSLIGSQLERNNSHFELSQNRVIIILPFGLLIGYKSRALGQGYKIQCDAIWDNLENTWKIWGNTMWTYVSPSPPFFSRRKKLVLLDCMLLNLVISMWMWWYLLEAFWDTIKSIRNLNLIRSWIHSQTILYQH